MNITRNPICGPLLLGLALATMPARAAERPANPTTIPFATSGSVVMELHAGAAEIVGTKESRISVSYTTQSSDDKVEVKVVQSQDGQATVRVNGPSNHFKYRIEVPEHSDLLIRMTAGDLEISGIRGNKDVELRAGNLELTIGAADEYGKVDASVTSGGLEARPWNVDKGGLWRSFKAEGKGQYRLHLHVGAGALEVRQAKSASGTNPAA